MNKKEKGIIFGRNSIVEYLSKGKIPEKLFLKKGIKKDDKVNHIINLCKKNRVEIDYVNENKLDSISHNSNHQGVVLLIKHSENVNIVNFEKLVEELSQQDKCCIALLDSIQDTRNMGSIIRTAEFFGISAVIIPEKNSAPVNDTVYKTSSGAVEHIKISVVTNLKYAIELLKQNDFWIYGTYIDDGETLSNTTFDKKSAIVLGSEHKGIRRSVKNACDYLIFIKRMGQIDSLNVSVSSGVLFYEYSKQHLS